MKLAIKTTSTRVGNPEQNLLQLFDAVPRLQKQDVAATAVEAGARVIVPAAKELTPRSKDKDTRRRSRSQRSKANWDIPLHTTITHKVDRYNNSSQANAAAIVGPSWPDGNKAYFFTSPSGRRIWLWGRKTGRRAAAVRNWIVQATEETRGRQIAAMGNALKRGMAKVWQM